MINPLKAYRFINLLSVDVSVGAIASAFFFSRVLNVRIGAMTVVTLGLSVWVIYTADHLMDARRIRKAASTERHRFHQKHFAALVVVASFLLMLDSGIVIFIGPDVLRPGILLGLIVAVYLVTQRYVGYMKEFVGAALYTSGVSLPALISFHGGITLEQIMVGGDFMLLAWINLLLFSLYDIERDRENDQVSFATVMGSRITQGIIDILFITVLIINIYLFTESLYGPAIILSSMSMVLFMLLLFRRFFSNGNRFRYLGDAVFLIPLIVAFR